MYPISMPIKTTETTTTTITTEQKQKSKNKVCRKASSQKFKCLILNLESIKVLDGSDFGLLSDDISIIVGLIHSRSIEGYAVKIIVLVITKTLQ